MFKPSAREFRSSGPTGGPSARLVTLLALFFSSGTGWFSGCTWISKAEFDAQELLLDQDGDGISAEDGDCDPTDGNVYPGAEEVWYDGIDADCARDDDYDADKDGWVPAEYEGLTTQNVGGSGGLRAGDCDDANNTINPASVDSWYDGIDADCAGNDDNDADSDGFASIEHGGDDCFDGDPAVYPGATEVWLDGIDSDCAGDSDYDEDGDGFAPTGLGNRATLYAPAAPVVPDGDCDDTDPDVNAAEPEVYYDGKDNDCDPATPDLDQDLDGFELGGSTEPDCDDEDPTAYPGADEVVSDAVDHDCDGLPGTFADQDLVESGPLFDATGSFEATDLYPLQIGAGPVYLWFALGASELTLPLVSGEEVAEDAILAFGVPLDRSDRGIVRRQYLVDFPLSSAYSWSDDFAFLATTSPGSGGTAADLLLAAHSIHTSTERLLRIGGYNDRTNQSLGAYATFAGSEAYDDFAVALGTNSRAHAVGCVEGGVLDIVSGDLFGGSGDLTTGTLRTAASLAGEGAAGCALDAFSDPSISVSLAHSTGSATRATYSRDIPEAGITTAETYSVTAADVDIAEGGLNRVVVHLDSAGGIHVTTSSGTATVTGVTGQGKVHSLVTGDTRGLATADYILSGVQQGGTAGWFAVGNNATGYAAYDLAPANGEGVVDAVAWLDDSGRVHAMVVTDSGAIRYGSALY